MKNNREQLTKEILGLKKGKSAISPNDVINFAKKHPKSECYHRFERRGLWNDKQAADVTRLEFARDLIKEVTIITIDTRGRQVPVAALINLVGTRKKGEANYEYRIDVLNDVAKKKLFREDLIRDLKEVRRRYADLWTPTMDSHLEAIFKEISIGGRPRKFAAAASK